MIERKGSHIFSLIQRDLHKLTFSRNFKQHCIKCGKYCPRFPSLSSLSGALQIDISGSTCVGFTTAGKQWQLLDDSIIPFAIWCWTVKSVKPDLIIHECVTGFPVTLLDAALNHDEAPPLYQVSSCVFDTTDLGIPVKRKRRYTVCRRLPSKAVAEYSLRIFNQCLFRSWSSTAMPSSAPAPVLSRSSTVRWLDLRISLQAIEANCGHGRRCSELGNSIACKRREIGQGREVWRLPFVP